MEALPFAHVWLPYIYLYVAGGLLFFFGIIVTIKSGSLDMKRKKHKIWMAVLLFGLLWFMVMHACWTLAAIGQYRSAVTIALVFLAGSIIGGFYFITKIMARA